MRARETFKMNKLKVFLYAALLLLPSAGWCASGCDRRSASASDPAALISACDDAIAAWGKDDGDEKLSGFYFTRAGAYGDREEYDRAIEDLYKAVELTPSVAEIYMKRGTFYNRSGHYRKAVEDFTVVTRKKPNSKAEAWAYYNMAIAYSLMGQDNVGATYLKVGQSLAPDLHGKYLKELEFFRQKQERRLAEASASCSRGKELALSGKFDDALAAFDAAMKLDPENPDYISWRASVRYELGQYDKALAELTSVPRENQWNYYIGLSQIRLGDFESAKVSLEASTHDEPPRNREKYVAAEAKQWLDRIALYQQNYKKAIELDATPDTKGALAAAQAALSAIETREAKGLVKKESDLLARQAAASKRNVLIFIVLAILVGGGTLVGVLGFRTFKTFRARQEQQKQDFIAKLSGRSPRDMVMAYFDYKGSRPQDALRVLMHIKDKVAESRDLEIIRHVLAELPAAEKKDFVLASAESLLRTGKFQESLDALLLVNNIPHAQWGEREIAVFRTAHLICDPTILKGTGKADPALWHQEIGKEAYLSLARVYADRKDHGAVMQVLSKMPVYKWEDAHWKLYLDSMRGLNMLDKASLGQMPASFRMKVMEELFVSGNIPRVWEFISMEPRQNWLPEYYFYAFCRSLTRHFDEAWEYVKEYYEKFDITKNQQALYMMAVGCELAGRPDKAAEAYAKLLAADPYYKDTRARIDFIKNGQLSSLKPSAAEILSPILPKGFTPKKPAP